MTKRLNSKYKRIRQFYIDLWENGKKNVKPLKKVFLLNTILYLIEEKKNLIRLQTSSSQSKIFSKKNISKVNTSLLPKVESVLKQIPNKYMDRNRKTRIYKYIKRKNQQLFQSRDQIISDLIFILERKRKKPFWRRTKFEISFRLKHLIQQFYGNLLFNQFRRICRKNRLFLSTGVQNMGGRIESIQLYKLLESRADCVLFRSGIVPSIFAARQLINHGHILLNGVCISSSSITLRSGDVIEVQPKSYGLVDNYVQKKKILSIFYFLNNFINREIFSSQIDVQILNILKNITFDQSLNIDSSVLENLKVEFQTKQHMDSVNQNMLFKKFSFYLKSIPDHIYSNKANHLFVYLNPPKQILYPFEFKEDSFKKIINFLNQ